MGKTAICSFVAPSTSSFFSIAHKSLSHSSSPALILPLSSALQIHARLLPSFHLDRPSIDFLTKHCSGAQITLFEFCCSLRSDKKAKWFTCFWTKAKRVGMHSRHLLHQY